MDVPFSTSHRSFQFFLTLPCFVTQPACVQPAAGRLCFDGREKGRMWPQALTHLNNVSLPTPRSVRIGSLGQRGGVRRLWLARLTAGATRVEERREVEVEGMHLDLRVAPRMRNDAVVHGSVRIVPHHAGIGIGCISRERARDGARIMSAKNRLLTHVSF